MFVTVKFGEEQEEIFNPSCRNDILLQFIKRRCRVRHEDVVELSDERGVIKNLRHFPQDYATAHLKNREKLILLRVESTLPMYHQSSPEETAVERAIFIPLLASLTTNAEFIDILNPARDDDTLSEASFKSRRRSSMMDVTEENGGPGSGSGGSRMGKVNSKSKGINSGSTASKKPNSRRGQRPSLKRHANTS